MRVGIKTKRFDFVTTPLCGCISTETNNEATHPATKMSLLTNPPEVDHVGVAVANLHSFIHSTI